jgi:hypothetical protein
LLHQLYGTAAN